MTINPASALEGGNDYAVQIEAGAVTNFSEIAYAGIVSLDETTWTFSVSSAAVFTTNANTGTNSDTWTAGANWDVPKRRGSGYWRPSSWWFQPPGGPAGYVAWAAGPFANPFTETAPSGNPDGDSMSNLIEFAFNAAPTVNNDSALSWDGTTLVSGTPAVAVSGEGTNVGSPTARFFQLVVSEAE